jgi:hypothetical protein
VFVTVPILRSSTAWCIAPGTRKQPPRGKLRGGLPSVPRCLNFARENPVGGFAPGNIFCDSRVRLLASQQEALMRFSMNSYLLGVGTVVSALAFGFGGGILLTKTAIKDTPAGPSRMERAARPEPAPAAPQVQVTDAKAVPVPHADPSPAVQPASEPAPQVQAAAETPKPVLEVSKEKPATVAEPVRQIDASKQAEQTVRQADAPKQVEQPLQHADVPKQMEQPVRHGDAKPVEQKESEQRTAEREQRRAEQRRIEREKRTAERERKARTVIIVRRQRPIEEQDQPARPELAFEREEARPNLFEGLFGRPTGDTRE